MDGEAPHDRRWGGLVVLCTAMFISAVDMTIVNVALPDISSDLGAGVGELQWVLDGFLVALAGLLLVGSGLADRFGRKRVFLTALSAFAATSVLAALAQTPIELIAARALMGAAAAGVLPPALSLIAVMFPPEERPRALGYWAAAAGAALCLGPAMGGVLVEAVGWQFVFLVNVPFILVAVPAGTRLLPESRRPGAPPLDLVGAGLSIVALTGIVFALIEGPDTGFGDPPVIAAAVVGVAAALAFGWVELRSRAPLFDVRALVRPAVAAGGFGILAVYAAFLGVLFLLPQYVQYVHDLSVFASAAVLVPLGLGSIVAATFNARVTERLGTRVTVSAGLAGLSASVALLMLLSRDTTLLVVVVSTALLGALITIAVPPATAVIMDDLGEAKAGDGGAINQLARQAGGALGVAVIGSVFAGVYTSRIDDALAGLPSGSRSHATESIQDAREVLLHVSQPTRGKLLDRVDGAFDVAARVGFGVAAAMLLAAAAFAAVALAPRRSAGSPDPLTGAAAER
jgi:EmrB/QacA subfamily drug resistance transporter